MRNYLIDELVSECGFSMDYAADITSRYDKLLSRKEINFSKIRFVCRRLVRLERKRLELGKLDDFPPHLLNST